MGEGEKGKGEKERWKGEAKIELAGRGRNSDTKYRRKRRDANGKCAIVKRPVHWLEKVWISRKHHQGLIVANIIVSKKEILLDRWVCERGFRISLAMKCYVQL